jgi:hypothetical protein
MSTPRPHEQGSFPGRQPAEIPRRRRAPADLLPGFPAIAERRGFIEIAAIIQRNCL